jgi:hypothetical protein
MHKSFGGNLELSMQKGDWQGSGLLSAQDEERGAKKTE